MTQPTSILITGASSGIGEALALEYASTGVHLALSGRDAGRLESVAERCRALGATVTHAPVDVADQAAMHAWMSAIDQAHPLDLVIANAGVSGGSGNAGETESQARAIFDVNLGGVLNTVWPAITAMRPRASGHIVILSSLASLTPLPGAPAYSASKAAVKAYGEALSGTLKPDGITVTTICPGFVESRITQNNPFPMPLLMTAPKAAAHMRKGLDKARTSGRVSLIFPWPLAALTWLVSVLPPCLRVWVLSKAPKKP